MSIAPCASLSKVNAEIPNMDEDLPPEILEQIFLWVTDDSILPMRLPPVTSTHPWVLGRVCRSWRRVSRSMPKLWKASITFSYDFLVKNKEGVSVTDKYKFEVFLAKLKHAIDVLPRVASVELYLMPSESVPLSFRRLNPYLPFISDLSWFAPFVHPQQESLDVLSPSSLSRLKSLIIGLPKTQPSFKRSGFFVQASNLQYLTLKTDTPTLLLSDIPWDQLQLFNLSFANRKLTDQTRTSWLELARLNPFHTMTSLTTLFFDMKAEYLEILLPLSFPWHQLKSLTIYWKDKPDLLRKIIMTLERCTSLLEFVVGHGAPLNVVLASTLQPVNLPSLMHVEWIGVPFGTIRAFISPRDLRSLKIGDINLQEFYQVVEQCPRLSNFTCRLVDIGPDSTRNQIFLSQTLTSLDIFVASDECFPTLLRAPLLVSFSIRIPDDFDSPLLVEHILHFVSTCNGQLQKFSLDGVYGVIPSPIPSQTALTPKLLSSLKSCFEIHIFLDIVTVDDMLPAFATGALFPRLDELEIVSSDPNGFFESFQRRIEREDASGMIKLRYLKILFFYSADIVAPLEVKFRDLEARYRIRCQVAWIAVHG